MVIEYGFCCVADKIIIYPSKRRSRNIRYTNLVITVPPDVLEPDGARPSVDSADCISKHVFSKLFSDHNDYRSVTWWRLTKLVTISREVFHCECPPPPPPHTHTHTFTGFLCIFIDTTLSLHNRSPCHSICIRVNTPPCHWHFQLQCSDCLSTL